MGNDRSNSLSSLLHDVVAKCSNLKNAAALLREEPADGELELLALMVQQARSLADDISAYETARRGRRQG